MPLTVVTVYSNHAVHLGNGCPFSLDFPLKIRKDVNSLSYYYDNDMTKELINCVCLTLNNHSDTIISRSKICEFILSQYLLYAKLSLSCSK